MMTDIEIAQNAAMKPIYDIAQELGGSEEFVEPYGKYKAKLSDELIEELSGPGR